MQFPASNDEIYLYLWKMNISNIELLVQLIIYHVYQKLFIIKSSDISIDLKNVWNRI